MDLEFYLKLIPVTLGVFGAIIAYLNFSTSSRASLREQYKFAKEAMKDFKEDPKMHPFIKEKALQAIAGTKTILAEEMEYILSLDNSSMRLNEFSKAKKLLIRFDKSSSKKFAFKGRYNIKMYRIFLKTFYSVVYFTFAFAAFSPIVFAGFIELEAGKFGLLFLFTLSVFGFYAFVAANAFVKLRLGERLVSNQTVLIRNVSFIGQEN
ncbi:hypothetical protein [Neptunomonas phycophila]|uniref:hypothetical protein n=1 Tax=Neptunomonas phycophila TaxID=1572645 RepID=UPI000948E305|nr:hypothetical protein [Neptunomonas phycophila]